MLRRNAREPGHAVLEKSHAHGGRDLADLGIKTAEVADHAPRALGPPSMLRVPGRVVAVAVAARHQVAREDGYDFIGAREFSMGRWCDAS